MSAPTSLRERREVLATARRVQRETLAKRQREQHRDHTELTKLARELPIDDPILSLALVVKIDTFVKIHGLAAAGWYLLDLAEIIRSEFAEAVA